MPNAGRATVTVSYAAMTRFLCSFSVVILVVYTLKDAGTILLAGYTQRASTTRSGEHAVFVPTHLVMCVEATKLLMSLLWCAYDVTQHMISKTTANPGARGSREANDQSAALRSPRDNEWHTAVRVDDATTAARLTKLPTPPPPPPTTTTTLPALHRLSKCCSRAWLRAYAADVTAHGNAGEVCLMAVPAIAYAVQNFLFIYALKMLNPSIFQLLYQLRIPLTALLMRVVLHTRITRRKWLAIVLLCVGVSATQLTATQSKASDAQQSTTIPEADMRPPPASAASNYAVGLCATLTACFVSSATSVFMELVFKKRTVHCSLATRNVHLSIFSIAWLLLASVAERNSYNKNTQNVMTWSVYWSTYLRGFTGLVWLLVVMQAIGGILVALVMKYADNILKSFCNAVAIVAVGVASVYLFDFVPSMYFVTGSILVLFAIGLYNG